MPIADLRLRSAHLHQRYLAATEDEGCTRIVDQPPRPNNDAHLASTRYRREASADRRARRWAPVWFHPSFTPALLLVANSDSPRSDGRASNQSSDQPISESWLVSGDATMDEDVPSSVELR